MKREVIHSTTVLGIIHHGQAVLGADGQATLGTTVIKNNVKKVRTIANGKLLVGFAGATADAFTLVERFEDKLSLHGNIMKRAAIELAKDWRTDRYLRRLEAMIIVMSSQEGLIISGTGDVLEPEHQIFAIGSGAMYAYSAALALKKHAPQLTAEEMVKEALAISADICIYTNHNIEILKLS
ncbi:MAG: ATP-dependent protease subunit HslV [Bacteroidia bacterium]|nr:ATP-dependent protease subunit HslV [Bacteroidia bacterium]